MFGKKNTELQNVELIVVDPGKHTTKALRRDSYAVDFRTKMFDNSQEVDVHGNSFSVEFESRKYVIGEQAEEQSYDVSKTNLLHKLVTYVAITQLAENNSIIQLVINCPVSIYKNKSLREEYKKYIFNNGQFNIVVNNELYNYELENVLVLPEDYGVVYKHPHTFKGRRIALIGLGGLNMNFMIIDSLVPEVSTMFTVNHGGVELESNVIKELNSKYALNIDPKEAPYILKNKGIKIRGDIDKESTQIVKQTIDKYVNTIIQEVKKNGHDLSLLDVVFVGGTSEAIQGQIEFIIKHAIVVKEAQWAAVEGSLKLGEIKYGEKAKSNSN